MSTDDPQQPQTPPAAPAPPGPPEPPAAPGPAPAPGPGAGLPPNPPGPQHSPATGGGAPRKKPVGLIIGIVGGLVALLAVLAVVLVIVLTGSGSGKPDDAVRAYMNATIDGDCEELVTHPIDGYDDVEECEDDIADSREAREDAGIEEYELTIESTEVTDEADDEATVDVAARIDYVQDGDDETDEFELTFRVVKNDDGDWVVDDRTDND